MTKEIIIFSAFVASIIAYSAILLVYKKTNYPKTLGRFIGVLVGLLCTVTLFHFGIKLGLLQAPKQQFAQAMELTAYFFMSVFPLTTFLLIFRQKGTGEGSVNG